MQAAGRSRPTLRSIGPERLPIVQVQTFPRRGSRDLRSQPLADRVHSRACSIPPAPGHVPQGSPSHNGWFDIHADRKGFLLLSRSCVSSAFGSNERWQLRRRRWGSPHADRRQSSQPLFMEVITWSLIIPGLEISSALVTPYRGSRPALIT
jgi:hypothetical protein